MERTNRRRITVVAGLLAIAALLGAGVTTYLVGGQDQKAAKPATPAVDIEKAPLRSFDSTEVLRLAWGSAARDVWADEAWFGSTFESLAVDQQGRILVADHPKWHVGARVRRFSAEGVLEKTWLTPSGSTFFEPLGDGIMFVLARGNGPSELVEVLREDGSVDGTFAVPAKVNSTALVRTEGVLGVTNQVPDVQLADGTMRIREDFFAVAELTAGGLRPMTVASVPAYGVDTAGRLYSRMRNVKGYSLDDATLQTVSLAGGRTLQLPDRATPIGVDVDTAWFSMPVATGPDDRVERPGWPLGTESDAEVLAARADGTLVARLIVPWSPRLADARRRLFVSKGAVWVATADARGVSIRRYEAVGK